MDARRGRPDCAEGGGVLPEFPRVVARDSGNPGFQLVVKNLDFVFFRSSGVGNLRSSGSGGVGDKTGSRENADTTRAHPDLAGGGARGRARRGAAAAATARWGGGRLPICGRHTARRRGRQRRRPPGDAGARGCGGWGVCGVYWQLFLKLLATTDSCYCQAAHCPPAPHAHTRHSERTPPPATVPPSHSLKNARPPAACLSCQD